jgi:hypothetical protein
MRIRRATVLAIAGILAAANWAGGEAASGSVEARIATANGVVADGALVELVPASGPGAIRSARVAPGATRAAISAPSASYRVRVTLAGFRPAETILDLTPGAVVSLDVRLAPAGGSGESTVLERDRRALAYQTAFASEHLGALPSSPTVWSLVETAHPFLIADRVDGGGIWTGEPSILGGQGSSGTQTTFRLDGIDVTDPQITGTPLFHPDLGVLQAVTVESAGIDPAAAGPGPVIGMVLRRPGDLWTGTAHVSSSPSVLQANGSAIPPIARLDSWIDGGMSAGGPVAGPRLGLFASGRATRVRRVEREQPLVLDGAVRSLTAHVVGRASAGDNLRGFASLADATRPLAGRARFADRALEQRDRALVLHAAWERLHGGGSWSVEGAFQRGTTDADVASTAGGGTIERLRDGPPLNLVDTGNSVRRRWDVHAGFAPPLQRWLSRDHILRLGATIGAATSVTRPGAQPAFAELVNGRPARVWDVRYGRPESRRAVTAASAFAADRMLLGDAVTVTTALRLDIARGSADGASSSIRWLNWSPRVGARWTPTPDGRLAVDAGYARYRHRLPLGYLSVGDPAGPSGVMYRWDDRNGDRGYAASELTEVAAVGFCCAGTQPGTIDSDLRRPSTDEFYVGAEHAIGSWRWRIAGLDRRERDLAALVNDGVTLDDYTVSYVEDPGVDIAGLSGYTALPIYNRRPDSFGRDRYTLTNAIAQPSRYQGIELTLERAAERWFFRLGGSAYRSEGVGANRGYRADENDQGLPGEAFVAPNAATSARGRLFFDRGYVLKIFGSYTTSGPLRASFVARYQDGQPFARMVIAEGLNQGTEIIQAYPRGGQRFTYALTLDARVDAQWPLGGKWTLGVGVDTFNLLGLSNEVEEDIVTGSAFRTVTAVQPPRVIRLGLRVGF